MSHKEQASLIEEIESEVGFDSEAVANEYRRRTGCNLDERTDEADIPW